MGLPQLASFKMLLGPTAPTTKSLDITGRGKILVDRIAAKVVVSPSNLGALPTMDQVRAVERLVRFRLALDSNDKRVLTIGDVSASTFSQLDQGPVPVTPFELQGQELPTIKTNIESNLFQNAIFTAFGPVNLEVVFWGQEA